MKKHCSEDCESYPSYGVAPHECFYKKGPEFVPGQSTLLPKETWPDNFVLELEPGERHEDVRYPSACGVYFCPSCKSGMEAWIAKWSATGECWHPSINHQSATRDTAHKEEA